MPESTVQECCFAVVLGGLVVAGVASAANGNPISRASLDSSAASAAEAASGGETGESAPSAASFEWSTLYASRYAFQGLDYSEGRPVFQPSASASMQGFTLGLWGNADQARREGVKDLRQAGLLKVKSGQTSLEEVEAVTNI